MTTSEFKIWSCKLKRPDTLKSHRTLEAATKKAGDHGFVFDPSTNTVFQVMTLASGQLRRYNTATEAGECNTGNFDMRKAMHAFNIPMPSAKQ